VRHIQLRLPICETVVSYGLNAFGTHLFSAETDLGRRWLVKRAVAGKCEWLGKLVSVDNERDARDLVDAALANRLDVAE
jgi:hypothetical protein